MSEQELMEVATDILKQVNIILYGYIMFGRGICKKYQSRDEKFPESNGERNLVSRLVFFANTPPKHDISVQLHRILFRTLAK
jgi:hypothetical protein